jgi:transposase
VSQKVSYETKRLDHLGIVAGICQEIGLAEVIDEQVGENGRQVSVGQATQAMILNGLGFSSRALYLTPEFFANKPVELLVGPGVSAAMLNDDTLGRALDALYAVGVTELFARVATAGCRALASSTSLYTWTAAAFICMAPMRHGSRSEKR